jgi:hypothetical protein
MSSIKLKYTLYEKTQANMTYNQENKLSTRADIEITQMLELVDKHVKMPVYIFKYLNNI